VARNLLNWELRILHILANYKESRMNLTILKNLYKEAFGIDDIPRTKQFKEMLQPLVDWGYIAIQMSYKLAVPVAYISITLKGRGRVQNACA
jgi:hypothetical protein